MAETRTFTVGGCPKILKMLPLRNLWTLHYVCFSFINSWYIYALFITILYWKLFLFTFCFVMIRWLKRFIFSGIKEVYYGCANDKFGGCGSILSLHLSCTQPNTRFISEPKTSKIFLLIELPLNIFSWNNLSETDISNRFWIFCRG